MKEKIEHSKEENTEADRASSQNGQEGHDEKADLVREKTEELLKEKPELEEAVKPPTVEEKLDSMEAELGKYNDLYMRKSAELENYRRQKEKQFSDFLRYAHEDVIRAFLPVVDDISRTLKSAEESKVSDIDAFAKGLKLIEQNIEKILEERGVKKLEVLGKKLDVSYHEAMAQIEKEGVEPEVVVDVFEDGYQLHDKVIRHAKVVVSK